MILLKRGLHYIIEGGITNDLSSTEKISVRNANWVIFTSITLTLVFAGIAFHIDLNSYAWTMIFTAVGMASGSFLIRLGKSDLGKFIAMIYGALNVFSTHDLLAPKPGSGLFFLVLIFYPLAVFSRRPWIGKILSLASFVFWLWASFLPPHLLFSPGVVVTFFPSWFLQASSGTLLVALFLHLVSQHRSALLELEIKNLHMIRTSQIIALGEMAGGIAHEINNPLQNILGRAERINILAGNQPDHARYVEESRKIIQTVDRISKIINGLRNFSRTSELVPRTSQLFSEILHDVIDLCQERFRNSQVDIRLKVSEGLYICCNPIEFSQVLLNLLNNSFDAVSKKPQAWVHISTETSPQHIYIYVTDSGDGIPEEHLDRIMKPFFTTKDIGHGTGLGLSISKGIIESHGGILYYDPAHENTRFVIRLPVTLQEDIPFNNDPL